MNTPTLGSLYEKYPPEIARRYANRLEIHYTPKHGSWLDAAEIALSVLTKMCLNRRIADMAAYCKEVRAWQEERNRLGGSMKWQFNSKNARIKLKKLYPYI
ncbi:hypothetical protein FACS1894189_7950 [Planctomycetales bacterium]|nr:hypothetical protein FACS1894189_7950 [Planctomycetales bacterium]